MKHNLDTTMRKERTHIPAKHTCLPDPALQRPGPLPYPRKTPYWLTFLTLPAKTKTSLFSYRYFWLYATCKCIMYLLCFSHCICHYL